MAETIDRNIEALQKARTYKGQGLGWEDIFVILREEGYDLPASRVRFIVLGIVS